MEENVGWGRFLRGLAGVSSVLDLPHFSVEVLVGEQSGSLNQSIGRCFFLPLVLNRDFELRMRVVRIMEYLRRALVNLGILVLNAVVSLVLVVSPQLMVSELLALAVLDLQNLRVDWLLIHFYLINLLLSLIIF